MSTIAKKTFTYGAHQVTLETGEIARQSGAAIMVSMGDTVVLVSVVGNKAVKPGQALIISAISSGDFPDAFSSANTFA